METIKSLQFCHCIPIRSFPLKGPLMCLIVLAYFKLKNIIGCEGEKNMPPQSTLWLKYYLKDCCFISNTLIFFSFLLLISGLSRCGECALHDFCHFKL